jgi:hypothetical protein
MSCKLSIRNAWGGAVHLFLDDIRIDTLKPSGTVKYPIPCGPHVVYCRTVGLTSEILRVEAAEGEAVKLLCVPGWRDRFLTGDPGKTKLLFPLHCDRSRLLVPVLLLVNLVLPILKFSTLTAGERADFPFLPAAVLFLASIAVSAGLGIWIAGRLARRPIRTGSLLTRGS